MKRTRLKRRGRRAEREKEALVRFQSEVYMRCGAKPGDPFHVGVCERCHEPRPLHAHHRLTNPRVHDSSEGHGLCFTCHIAAVHQHEGADWGDWVGRRRMA